MKNLELKAFRISLTLILILGISYLFSTVFFHVTNSDGIPYIPSGQSQITFENNEFDDSFILLIVFPLPKDTLSKSFWALLLAPIWLCFRCHSRTSFWELFMLILC